MLFSELKCKDVINIRDCKKLGHVCEPNIVIPYKDIRQIGPDIILVDINC